MLPAGPISEIDLRHLQIPIFDGPDYQTLLVVLRDNAGNTGFGEITFSGHPKHLPFDTAHKIAKEAIGKDATRYRSELFPHRSTPLATAFLTALDVLERHPSLLEPARHAFSAKPKIGLTLRHLHDMESLRDAIEFASISGDAPHVGDDLGTDITALIEAASQSGLTTQETRTTGFLRSSTRLLSAPPRIDDGHIVLPGGTPKLDWDVVDSHTIARREITQPC